MCENAEVKNVCDLIWLYTTRTDGPSDVSKTRGAEDWVPVAPEAKQVQSMIEAASGSAEDQPDTPADSALLPQMKPLPAGLATNAIFFSFYFL